MARTYAVLTQAEQDDMVVATVHAQEQAHFQHALNVERYTAMVADMPEGPFKERITALLVTEQAAVSDHEQLLDKTVAQLPKGPALLEAVARVEAKRG